MCGSEMIASKVKRKDTSAYETLMSKVEGSGKDNKSFTTPIYENNPALQDLEKHRQRWDV